MFTEIRFAGKLLPLVATDEYDNKIFVLCKPPYVEPLPKENDEGIIILDGHSKLNVRLVTVTRKIGLTELIFEKLSVL